MRKVIGCLCWIVLWLTPISLAASDAQSDTQDEQSNSSKSASIEAPSDPTQIVGPPSPSAAKWAEYIPTSAFAAQRSMRRTSLSPDGSKLAVQTVVQGRDVIGIFDADTRQLITTVELYRSDWFNWMRWAGNERLLYSMDGNPYSTSRRYLMTGKWTTSLYVYDLQSSERRFIGFEEQGFEGDDVLYVDPDGAYLLLSISLQVRADPYVYRFPLDGSGEGGAERVQNKRKGIDEWWADNEGVVRLGMRHRNRSKFTFFYRSSAQDEWAAIDQVRKDGSGEIGNWNVLSIRAGSDTGYALVDDGDGRKVLRELDYRTGTPGSLIYAHPARDVDGILLDKDSNLMGATYTDHTEISEWFDPQMKALQTGLEAALGAGEVEIISRAGDARLLVRHGAAADPGAVYIFSPEAGTLDLFDEYRPGIDFEQLAPVTPFAYTARDGVPIEGYLTVPKGLEPRNLPLIIMPHGGPYGVRDTARYDDEVQLLANRGYAVMQPNYRGSGGYGSQFEALGFGQIGRAMQDDLDDAMDWAVTTGLADPARICVVGGSYGGYAALWAVTRNPERYRCAASWAGVTDFATQLEYDRDYLNRRARKRLENRIDGAAPINLDQISPVKNINRLQRPVLIAHGVEDRRVPFSQFRQFTEAAQSNGKTIETLVLRSAGHSFGSSVNEQAWYDALIGFLAQHNPSDRPAPASAPDAEQEEGNGTGLIKRVDRM